MTQQLHDASSLDLLTTGIGWVHELETVCQRAYDSAVNRNRSLKWARQLALEQVRLPESKNWINIWFDEKEEQ